MTTPSSDRWTIKPAAVERPLPRLIITGAGGVGKTTFGCAAPSPLLIPTEDGALAVPVPKLPADRKAESYKEVLRAIQTAKTVDHDCQWLVVDTLNGVEMLLREKVCDEQFKGNWGESGFAAFQRGSDMVAQEIRGFLDELDRLRAERKMGIILLAHSGILKQSNAFGNDYQKLAGNMHHKAWSVCYQWADQVAYAGHEMATTDPRKGPVKVNAIGSSRTLRFEGGPAADCKSRTGYEMPAKIDLSWEEYWREYTADRLGALVKQALLLLTKADSEVVAKVTSKLGEVSEANLRAAGKNRLENLIGWLINNTNSEEN